MKKNPTNFSDFVREVEPLKRNVSGEMTGGFAPYGGQDQQTTTVLRPFIMNTIMVAVLGYSCQCSCQCGC